MARMLVAAMAIFLTTGAVLADHRGVPHVRLTFGMIAFNEDGDSVTAAPRPARRAPGTPQVKTADPLVWSYLQHIAKSVESEADVEFDIVRGNYYQILHWMRDGTIDGALVSPFIYEILLADSADEERQPLGVANVTTTGLAAEIPELEDGNAPAFRALRGDTPLDDPQAVLARCVAALVEQNAPQCTFHFVSHLSTTGFIYPLARIDEILQRDHRKTLDAKLNGGGETVRSRLLERTRFTLWHKELKGVGTRLEFSYANELYRRQVKSKSPTFIRDGKWAPLMPDDRSFADDVIAISAISTNGRLLRPVLTDVLPAIHNEFEPPKTLERYRAAQPVDPVAHRLMRAVVDQAFDGRNTNSIWNQWYVDENFDFSVDELISLLRNDQIVGGRTEAAALVLPGGGVRGAYQAGMLDELYERHLINFKAVDPTGRKHRERLVVKSVVGTSGGALMGYFAARRAPHDGRYLTNEWMNGDEVRIRLSEVFPSTGAVRCLSMLMAVAIFGLCAALLWAKVTTGIGKGAPAWLNFALLLLCVLAPLSVFKLSQSERVAVPWGAGAVYATLILLTHAYHSIIQPTGAKTKPSSLYLGGASILVGLGTVGHVAFNPSTTRVGREILLAVCGFTMLLAGLFLIAFYFGVRPVWAEMVRYLKAAGTLLAFAAGVLALFSIAVVFEYATSLELTADYWLVLIATSIIVAAAIASLSAFNTTVGRFLDEGLDFWFRTRRSSRLFYTPMLSLLGAAFAGVLSWIAFVAPALYDGQHGAETFKRKAQGAGDARAYFLAALTNLGTPPATGGGEPLPTGDYYAIERIPGVKQPHSPRLLDWDKEQFRDAVTASGSPFPIYPGRKLEHPRGTAIFVDGGYTHLVPIDGAVNLMQAKQVLVVSNVKRPAKNEIRSARSGIWSLLISDAGRTFNFLFNRAQQVDVDAGSDVIVATIAPVWPMKDPFLMDFRPRTIRKLIEESWLDTRYRRPGRVTSWGIPTGFVGPPHTDTDEKTAAAQTPPRTWQRRRQEEVTEMPAQEGVRASRSPAASVSLGAVPDRRPGRPPRASETLAPHTSEPR